MDILKLVLIDDDPQGLRVLEKIVGDSHLLQIVFSTTDPLLALDYVRANSVDVLITDIVMDKMHGIHLASLVEKMNIPVIICSAYKDYAYDSYQVNAVDFIYKPAEPAKFFKAIGKLHSSPDPIKDSYESYFSNLLAINEQGSASMTLIRWDDIQYIRVDGNYLEICTSTRNYIVLMSLTAVMEKLPASIFYRIHRSYTVNLKKILKLKADTIYLEGGHEIPLGSSYYEEFYGIFRKLSINSPRRRENNR